MIGSFENADMYWLVISNAKTDFKKSLLTLKIKAYQLPQIHLQNHQYKTAHRTQLELTSQSNFIRIPTESSDIILKPFHSGSSIQETKVLRFTGSSYLSSMRIAEEGKPWGAMNLPNILFVGEGRSYL